MRPFIVAFAFALFGCAPTTPADAEPLILASWNMEHLAEANGSGCHPRSDADYVAMRAYIDAVDADVIAFQEVETAAAAARVFNPEHYVIVMEERRNAPGGGCNNNQPGQHLLHQAAGFAIRRGLAFDRNADFTGLQYGSSRMRSGVDITLRPLQGPPIRLLSVHLKSRCWTGDPTSSEDCEKLFRQVRVLEDWFEARAAWGESFAVLGDINRMLARPDDIVWADWNDGDPPNADLTLAAGAVEPRCGGPSHFVDHIMVDRTAAQRLGPFREWAYSGEHLSDHCAISVTLN